MHVTAVQSSDQAKTSPRTDVTPPGPPVVFGFHIARAHGRMQSTPVPPQLSSLSSNQSMCLQVLLFTFSSEPCVHKAFVPYSPGCPWPIFWARYWKLLYLGLTKWLHALLSKEMESPLGCRDKNCLFSKKFQCHLSLQSLFQGQMMLLLLPCPQWTKSI